MTSDDEGRFALRDFRPADAEVVARWFPDHAAAIDFAGAAAPWPYRPAHLLEAAADPTRHAYTLVTAADPDGVLGHVEVVTVTATTGRLARVALAPHLRGRGLSRAILTLAVDAARSARLRELALFVVPGNTAAFRAYRAVGFVDDAADPGHPEYERLVRTLDRNDHHR